MAKVDSKEFTFLVSMLSIIVAQTNVGSTRRSEVKADFYNYAAPLLRQDLDDAIRNNLEENPEATAFPAIVDQLVKAVLDKTSTQKSFYAFTNIKFDDEGRPYMDRPPDLDWALGGYQDFIDGKLAGGGSEEPDDVSARKWYFIYRDFANGKGKSADTYRAIMNQRLSYWESQSVAPMWYWFSETIETELAFPYQKVTYLDQEIFDTIENFLDVVKEQVNFSYSAREEMERYDRLYAEAEAEEEAIRQRREEYWKRQNETPDDYWERRNEEEEVRVEYTPEVELRNFVPESIGFDVTIKVSGRGGERQVSMQLLMNKLESREWVVTKSYPTNIGGQDVIVAQIHRVTSGGRREFTGVRLEYR